MKKIIASILLVVCTLTMVVGAEGTLFVVGTHTMGQNGVELNVTFNATEYNSSVANDPAARAVLTVYDTAGTLCYIDAQKSNDGQLNYNVKLPANILDGAYKFCMSIDGSVQEYKEMKSGIYKADSNIADFVVAGETGGIVSAVCKIKEDKNPPTVLIAVYDKTNGMLLDANTSNEVTDKTITASLHTSGKSNITVKGYVFESLTNIKPLIDNAVEFK